MEDLLKVWNEYYEKTDNDTILKDNSFFSLEVSSILDQVHFYIDKNPKVRTEILELGSATGYLAETIVDSVRKKYGIQVVYTGVDFSEVAINKSRRRNLMNCSFFKDDFIEFLKKNLIQYDLIISQRSIMAIMDDKAQQMLLKMIRKRLNIDGAGIFSEGSRQALLELNRLRKNLNLDDLQKIWHSLYVDQEYLKKIFPSVRIIDFSSLYWLITRVIYPFFEEPKHNSSIHKFASQLKQSGNYGLVKLFLVKP
jgi:phospholipid N-methyltransferase